MATLQQQVINQSITDHSAYRNTPPDVMMIQKAFIGERSPLSLPLTPEGSTSAITNKGPWIPLIPSYPVFGYPNSPVNI